ncbi:MAG TPA: pyridoxamine 5'-phosphate oxidase family protein [Planctomycetota bacterium]|nr:pyridoxamine 5'-phosphate oxidase family protein [Planctomycetota bacterium]
MESKELGEMVRSLFASQGLAVLATQSAAGPHTSLVAFAATEDLHHIVFATERDTRKYANLAADPRVALLVDDRSHREADLAEATAVTAGGRAEEAAGEEKKHLLKLLLRRHPALQGFVASPGCAILRVTVEAYSVVTRFQEVPELRP